MYHTIRTCFKCEDQKIELLEGTPREHYDLNLQVQETSKAITIYEMELFAYYLVKNYPRYENGSEYTKEYEDILAILEFYMNRLTSCNDDTIGELMTNLRFSVTSYMNITSNQVKEFSETGRYRYYTTRDKYNKMTDIKGLCYYESPLFTIKDLEHIDRLGPKDRSSVTEGFKNISSRDESQCNFDYAFIMRNVENTTQDSIMAFFDVVTNTIDGMTEGPSLYVRVSEEPLVSLTKEYWNSRDLLQSRSKKNYMPLIELIHHVENVINISPNFLGSQISKDLDDMRENRVRAFDVLLSEIGERDSDLESTNSTPGEVYDRMKREDHLSELESMARFIRVLHCILYGSKVDKTGSTKYITLRFGMRSFMRLLDPEIFGKVPFPDMLIVSDKDEMYNEYLEYLKNEIGFKQDGDTGALSHEYDLSGIQAGWGLSKRQKSRALPQGCISHIRSIKMITCEETINVLTNLKGYTVILVDKKDLDKIETIIGSLNKPDKKNLRFIIIKGDETFVSVNENIDDTVEVGVTDCRGSLYNIHSNGIVVKRQMASERTMTAICIDCSIDLNKNSTMSDLLKEKTRMDVSTPYEGLRNSAVKEFLEISRSLTDGLS